MSAGTVYFAGAKFEKGNKATDWTPAPEDQTAYVDASISSIQVGGRNLLTDSDDITKCFDSSSNITSIVGGKADPDGGNGAYLITPNTINWWAGPRGARLRLTKMGVSYTFSIWMRADNATQCQICCRYMDSTPYSSNATRVTVNITTEWKRFFISAPLKQVQTGDSVWIGYLSTTPIYVYHPMVEMSSTPSDWSPAPEDIEANAVKRTQRIWYRTNGSSAPATPGTASSNWVTKADDGNDAWTKMHIAINSTHKYIYTCEQYEMANGTVGYTSVLLDNTITVIDGSNIITGSVTANKLNAADINASKTLTVGAMTDAAASTILNSNVVVGGRNLLAGTDVWLTTFNSYSSCGKSSETIPAGSVVTVSVEVNADNLVWDTTSSTHRIGFETSLTKTGGGYQYFGVWAGNAISESANVVEAFTGSIHKRVSKTFTLLGDFELGRSGYIYTQGVAQGTVKVGRAKIEYGNKATDWTPAPEDMATNSSVDQTYVQNLTPYFLTDMTKTSDEYWANITYERFTRLGDGWAHFEYTNSGSSTVNNYIKPKVLDFLEPGGKYTLLIEFKNVSISKNGGTFYSQQGSDLQVWGDSSYCGFSITNAEIRALSGGAGTFYRTLTLLTADSKDPSGTVRGSLPKTSFMSINSQVAAGQTVSYDLRLSLYADGYTGPYKPYSGDQLYATNSALAGTNESLEGAIEDIGELSDQLVGTVTEQNKTITTIQTYLNSLRKDLDAEIQSRQQWLNFNAAEGLVIGAAGSSFKTVTTNTSQQFRSGGTILAETSGTEFVAPVMRSDQLLIGNWMWTRRDNGNLSLKWIG